MIKPRSPSRGVTLIEVLVVLALISIVLAVALPNLRYYVVRSRLNTPARDIERMSAIARLQAVNSQRPTSVVFVKKGGSYPEFSGQDFVGKNAVVVYRDDNGNGSFDTGETIAQVYLLPRYVDYRRPGGSEPVPTARITFGAGGSLVGGTNAVLYLGDELGNFQRLNYTGINGQIKRQMFKPDSTDTWFGSEAQGTWIWRY